MSQLMAREDLSLTSRDEMQAAPTAMQSGKSIHYISPEGAEQPLGTTKCLQNLSIYIITANIAC